MGVVLLNLQRTVGSTIGFSSNLAPGENEIPTTSIVDVETETWFANPGDTIDFVFTRSGKLDSFISVSYTLTGKASNENLAGSKLGQSSIPFKAEENTKTLKVKLSKKEIEEEKSKCTKSLSHSACILFK
jgi:hypothetical protein